VHEPAAAPFAKNFAPTIVFSHGLERRGWNVALATASETIKWRSRLLFPLWRIRPAEKGMRRAQGVLLVNREDTQFVLEQYRVPPERVFTFRNGVDPEALAAVPREQDFSVIFTGSWIARKGVHTLVEAARLLQAEGCEPSWTLLGTGLEPEEVLAHWPAGLRSRVQVIPGFPPEEEGRYLRSAAVFVLPSFSEGQPLALLQAMENGCCCISTNCCGMRDVITHEENGLLFSPGDAPALAGLLQKALRDVALRERLGSAARASMAGRRWSRVAEEVADRVEAMAEASARAS
jgi:glycosyltransferase involved in cell wall biosynthesis